MAGFKKSQPGLGFSGEQVTPDEMDVYNVYHITNPGTASAWFGTAAASGTSDTKAITVINTIADYPRNALFIVNGNGTSVAVKGTAILNGKDQFGSIISETLAITSGTGAGTAVGTKVFAQFTSGTFQYGTYSTSGTPTLGVVVGTNALFGLPVKISGTADVVLLSHNAGTGPVSVNGGTIGAFVNANMHAIRPAATLTGTEAITVWITPNYNPSNITEVSALKQI